MLTNEMSPLFLVKKFEKRRQEMKMSLLVEIDVYLYVNFNQSNVFVSTSAEWKIYWSARLLLSAE